MLDLSHHCIHNTIIAVRIQRRRNRQFESKSSELHVRKEYFWDYSPSMIRSVLMKPAIDSSPHGYKLLSYLLLLCLLKLHYSEVLRVVLHKLFKVKQASCTMNLKAVRSSIYKFRIYELLRYNFLSRDRFH